MRVLAVAAILLAACSHAPWNPYGGWNVVRTQHITVYTNTRFLHRTAADSLEYAYAGLASSLFRARAIAPVEVLFLEEPEFVAIFGRFRSGVTVARLPGHGILGRRGMVVLNEALSVSVAAHRLAHLFLHAVAPRAPLWVHEGYASYVETIAYRGDDKGNAVACLGNLSFNDSLIPLEDLFSWSWGGYDVSRKTDWYRHTARSLFDYFLSAENGSLHKPFAELMAAVNDGEDPRAALARIFPGMTVAALEQRIVQYRKDAEAHPRGLCPLPFPVLPGRGADVGGSAQRRVEALDRNDVQELFLRLRLLPRRAGYVDWFPPEALTLAGAGLP
jgi:hypothetical protein